MPLVIDIRRGVADLHAPGAKVLTFAQAGFGFRHLPIPDEPVTLFNGAVKRPGRIYAVHYGDETVTVAPDHD
jgi:hypothetical protein